MTATLTAPDHGAQAGSPAAGPSASAERAARTGDLLRRAMDGDTDSWQELFREVQPYLLYVAGVFRLGDEAQDVVQTAFLRLLEQPAAIRRPDAVRAWLATTVKNECLRILRLRGRERPSTVELDWEALLPDTGAQPVEGSLIRNEDAQLVARAVATLTARDQQLLQLLSDPDTDRYGLVSERLGMPVGSIGPTRQRALARVRRTLDTLGFELCA